MLGKATSLGTRLKSSETYSRHLGLCLPRFMKRALTKQQDLSMTWCKAKHLQGVQINGALRPQARTREQAHFLHLQQHIYR